LLLLPTILIFRIIDFVLTDDKHADALPPSRETAVPQSGLDAEVGNLHGDAGTAEVRFGSDQLAPALTAAAGSRNGENLDHIAALSAVEQFHAA